MAEEHPLRTLIAVTLQVVDVDGCYISPSKSSPANTGSTCSKVLAAFKKGVPDLDENYFRLADEIIQFFQELPKSSDYVEVMKREDATLFQACIDIAAQTTVTPVNVAFAVSMPNVYGKLKKEAPPVLLDIEDAVISAPDSFMGVRDVPNRFFVKLVHVGAYDKEFGGNCFELRDRNNNVGFFYEKAEKLRQVFYLGDCFSIYAKPMRHVVAVDGTKQTVFRTVEIVENKGPARSIPDPSEDVTGMFTRT